MFVCVSPVRWNPSDIFSHFFGVEKANGSTRHRHSRHSKEKIEPCSAGVLGRIGFMSASIAPMQTRGTREDWVYKKYRRGKHIKYIWVIPLAQRGDSISQLLSTTSKATSEPDVVLRE